MNKRDKILKDIYNSQIINKLASKHISKLNDYRDDFIQEMYLLLCEMPEDKLISLYENKELDYYIIYVAKAFAFNDNGDFWEKMKGRIKFEYTLDNDDYNNDFTEEDLYE